MPHRTRFTLIELLVVVAIIAILASLLLPALTAAKDSARMATCLATLKSIAGANGMYQSDYDDFTIHGVDMTYWWGGSDYHYTNIFDDDWWDGSATNPNPASRNKMTGGVQNLCHVGQLMNDSYLPQEARAIACPRDFTKTGKQNSMYTLANVVATLKTNWRADDYSGGPSYSYRSTNYVIRGPIYKVPRLANTARTAFMADHERDNQSNAGLPDGANPILYGWPFVHAKGLNIAYYDGHARFFADPQRLTTFNRWPGNNQTRWYGNGDALYIGRYDKE